MTVMNFEEMVVVEGGKFWGTGTISHTEQCMGQNSYQVCKQDYIFWIPVGGEYNCKEFGCPGYWELTQ